MRCRADRTSNDIPRHSPPCSTQRTRRYPSTEDDYATKASLRILAPNHWHGMNVIILIWLYKAKCRLRCMEYNKARSLGYRLRRKEESMCLSTWDIGKRTGGYGETPIFRRRHGSTRGSSKTYSPSSTRNRTPDPTPITHPASAIDRKVGTEAYDKVQENRQRAPRQPPPILHQIIPILARRHDRRSVRHVPYNSE